MKVYNTHALSRNQRFQNAIIYALPSSILLGIIFGFILRIIPITFDFMYIGLGYAIAYIIRTKGRGVQQRFSILGAILCLLSLVVADVVCNFGLIGLINPYAYIMVVMANLSFNGIWSIIGLLFRVLAIAVAYEQSRIV